MARLISSDAAQGRPCGPLLCAAGIAVALGLLTEQPAHASSVLGCAMTDTKGQLLSYSFVKGTDNSIHEFKMKTPKGHLIEYQYPDLPGWAAGWDNTKFWLVPDANRDYQMVVQKLGPIVGGWRYAKASVWKAINGKWVLVSDGACGTEGKAWERDASSPTYPVPSAPVVAAQPTPAPTYTPPSIPSPTLGGDTSIPDPSAM